MCEYAPAWITAGATVIYAIITICILLANRKSANAAKEQIEELKKQTSVNTGLQLYEKRTNALETVIGIPESSFDNYHCKQLDLDIALLFNEGIQEEYRELKSHSEAIKSLTSAEIFKAILKEKSPELTNKINELEQRIKNGYEEQVRCEYKKLCETKIQLDDGSEITYKEVKKRYETAEESLKEMKAIFVKSLEDYIRSSISN